MMIIAINEALKGAVNGYVPVGAVVVKDNLIIFNSHNKGRFTHVEMDICKFVFKENIKNFDVYITLEPCIACGSLLLQTPFNRIFFGAYSNKNGITNCPIFLKKKKNFLPLIYKECEMILKSFFFIKRLK